MNGGSKHWGSLKVGLRPKGSKTLLNDTITSQIIGEILHARLLFEE